MAYKRKHEFPPDGAKTEKQWNDAGYKVKKNENGQECWTNRNCGATAIYYNNSQVEEMSEIEKLNYKHKINLEKQRKRIDIAIEDAKREIEEKAYSKGCRRGEIYAIKEHLYKTAREWLMREESRKVKDIITQKICSGDKEFDEDYGFYYYHVLDTEPCSDEEANKLLNLWDDKVLVECKRYKGLVWWRELTEAEKQMDTFYKSKINDYDEYEEE